MAIVFPFQALRYQPAKVSLTEVVTQPYDKITPEMQDKYYAASPYNLARIILGKREATDNDGHNVYTRAAAAFADCRRQGVLAPDPAPSIYLYSQRFAVPGAPTGSPEVERRGFIALAQLEDYENGIVFPHERTHAAPKTDRLNLLRATRAHFGQLFMLYSDPGREIDALLAPRGEPDIAVRDEYCVLHRVWRISESGTIEQIRAAMAAKKLIIADGHHRYETALTYRNERRAAAGTKPDAPYERVMMTFVNMDSEGLLILPGHRVLAGLPSFDVAKLLSGAEPYFKVNEITFDPAAAVARLRGAGESGTALLAATRVGNFLLRAKPGAADQLLGGFSPKQRELDVIHLHKVLLEHVLGISEEAIRDLQNITYVRDSADAIGRLRSGADVAFIMNPVRIDQVRDIAFAGEVLPQKSTDFYPKLLSGLAIYALE
jgi:uncharacterized protein (DUF1015 family)